QVNVSTTPCLRVWRNGKIAKNAEDGCSRLPAARDSKFGGTGKKPKNGETAEQAAVLIQRLCRGDGEEARYFAIGKCPGGRQGFGFGGGPTCAAGAEAGVGAWQAGA